MVAKRKDDGHANRSWYRTNRLLEDGGQWYFLTREGTAEGPFECEADATEQLEVYVRLAVNDMLEQDFAMAMEA